MILRDGRVMENRNYHPLVIAVSPIVVKFLKLFSVFSSKSVYDAREQRTMTRIRQPGAEDWDLFTTTAAYKFIVRC